MVSSRARLALASFMISIRNLIQSLRRLQPLSILATCIEKRGAAQPKEWNPRHLLKLHLAAPNPQSHEALPSAQEGAMVSISCSCFNACCDHREAESSDACELLLVV